MKLKDSLEDSEIYMDDEEYLPLVLDSMGLYYAVYKDSGDKKALSEAQRLLEAYAKKAEGKEYSAYKYLFHRIRAYYFNRKEYKKMIGSQKDMILYDPSDYGQILTLMDYIRDYPDEIGDLDKFVKEFKEKGGVIDPEFDLTLLLASKKKNREKIEGSCAWLEKQSGASPEILMRALPRITKFISIKDKEALIEYYYALTDLALRQSSTEDRLTVFAAALNERQKLVNGNGYKWGFYTLFGLLLIYSLLSYSGMAGFMSPAVFCEAAIIVGAMVMVSYTLINDGYFAVNAMSGRIIGIIAVLFLLSLAGTVFFFINGTFFKDGSFGMGFNILLITVMLALFLAICFVKRNRGESEDEE